MMVVHSSWTFYYHDEDGIPFHVTIPLSSQLFVPSYVSYIYEGLLFNAITRVDIIVVWTEKYAVGKE